MARGDRSILWTAGRTSRAVIHRGLVWWAVSVVLSGAAPPVPGPPPPTKQGVAAIYYQTTPEFMRVKRSLPAGFDWGDDGCSVPRWLRVSVRSVRYAMVMFVDECRQHDFAYRNFGGRLGLDRSEAQRAVVDRHFYEQMKLRCRHRTNGYLQRTRCGMHARAFYIAVRAFGSFGGDHAGAGRRNDLRVAR